MRDEEKAEVGEGEGKSTIFQYTCTLSLEKEKLRWRMGSALFSFASSADTRDLAPLNHSTLVQGALSRMD